ncbi:MAG: 30S ribosomal protein S4 [Clostridiales bacterium]|jgi:small subunit ribosomal protein S4|nr:30S ribosomal protein S4 [Clostridiales bacterium]
MARYRGPSCRRCRREGQKLFLKGERCYTEKCPLIKRAYAPGQHGQGRRKLSEYGMQLREKQKAKRYYGILESQFAKYFEMANKKKTGITGENLLQILETRLDNVVYRLGFATSRAEARQMVLHRHFTLNGKVANIPSIIVKVGDTIALREKSLASERVKRVLEITESRAIPTWLDTDKNAHSGSVVRLPERTDVDIDIKEHLIVELYSK